LRLVMPAEFETFFLASAGASAALIGLLFVAVSIAPERVFGGQADAVRQAQALSAFTALANVFFISMASLIPTIHIGIVVTIVAIPAALQTLALLALVRHWRAEGIVNRGLVLFLGSALIYALELMLGIQLWISPRNTGALAGLLELLLGAYAIGLGRAWELLGAPRSTFISTVFGLLRDRRPPSPKS
jgi:hypothetical protein